MQFRISVIQNDSNSNSNSSSSTTTTNNNNDHADDNTFTALRQLLLGQRDVYTGELPRREDHHIHIHNKHITIIYNNK